MFALMLTMGFAAWGLLEAFDGSGDPDEGEEFPVTLPGTAPATDLDEPKTDEPDPDASGPDTTLTGSEAADRIKAGDGDDTISGGNGSDTLIGGAGSDEIEGGLRQDLIAGEDDDDLLRGDRDMDTLLGNDGNDTLEGGNWHDDLYGGGGEDVLDGGAGDDFLAGGFYIQNSDGSGLDRNAEFYEANALLEREDPDLYENGTSDEIFASVYFKDVDLDALDKPAGADGADTLIGGEGSDFIELHQGDTAWGGSPDGNDTSTDIFVLNADSVGAPALIQDYQPTLDYIDVDYNADDPKPTVTVEDQAGDSLIKVSGETLAIVRGAAGVLTVDDITLWAVTYS